MHIQTFFDDRTRTLTYVVHDPATRDAVIIDPVFDYEPVGSKLFTESVDAVSAWVRDQQLAVRWVLETHAHADHLSGAQVLKQRFGSPVAIGERITVVQETFRDIFALGEKFPVDGSQFDRLLADREVVEAGSLKVEAIATPGHTPACMSYRIGDAVFTGDALFMPDYGVGRCDFPEGDAKALYRSVHDRLYRLPDETRVFVGHDYQPGGREVRYETTIGVSKRENIQLREDTSQEAFVELRTARDRTLAAPKLLYPSIQVNIDAGQLPEPAPDGKRFLRIPLNGA